MLQRVPRSTTVLAVRLSQLACVPEGLLNYVKMKFPQVRYKASLAAFATLFFSELCFLQVGFRLVHLLGHYYGSNSRRTVAVNKVFSDNLSGSLGDPRSHIKVGIIITAS